MLNSNKGMAVFEVIPVLALFVLLLNFSLGFFGAIHSGILNSIAARNYAFETFRNRADLTFMRDISCVDDPNANCSISNSSSPETTAVVSYKKTRFRFHGVLSESKGKSDASDWTATIRPVKFTDLNTGLGEDDDQTHNQTVRGIASNDRPADSIDNESFNNVWVRTVYGICLDSKCEGQ